MKNRKSFFVILCSIVGVMSLGYIVFASLFVSEATRGMPMAFEQIMYNLFAMGAYIPLSALLLSLSLLLFKKQRAFFAKIFCWCLLLYSFAYNMTLFINAFNLPSLTFQNALNYLSDFAPSLCLLIGLIALISQWKAEKLCATNHITRFGGILSAFMIVWNVIFVVLPSVSVSAADGFFNTYKVLSHLIPLAIVGILFVATNSSQSFRVLFCNETEEG